MAVIDIDGVRFRSWRELLKVLGLQGVRGMPSDVPAWLMSRYSLADRSQLAPMMMQLKVRYLGIDPGLTVSSKAKEALGAMLDTVSLDGVRAATGMSLEHLLGALAELRRLADGA